MSEAALVNFELYDNEDFRSPELLIADEDGNPRDLTGVVLRMQVRREVGASNPAILDLTIGDGIVMVNAAGGHIEIEIGREDIPAGYYYHDMIEEVGSHRTLLWVGSLTMAKGVTRWS